MKGAVVDTCDFMEGYKLGYNQAQKEGKNAANRLLRERPQQSDRGANQK
jgi:hypothetical protein